MLYGLFERTRVLLSRAQAEEEPLSTGLGSVDEQTQEEPLRNGSGAGQHKTVHQHRHSPGTTRRNTMNALIRTAAFATLTLIGVSSSFAISNLPECYDKVISACNKGNHASSCAEGGMNQCDKQFPKPMIYKPE